MRTEAALLVIAIASAGERSAARAPGAADRSAPRAPWAVPAADPGRPGASVLLVTAQRLRGGGARAAPGSLGEASPGPSAKERPAVRSTAEWQGADSSASRAGVTHRKKFLPWN